MQPYNITTTLDDIFLRNKYWFDRPFHESNGYVFEHLENGNGRFIFNALGIPEDNIEISVEASDVPNRQLLKVHGKTDYLNRKFEVSYTFTIKPVKTITQTSKDGLLVLELEWNKPIAPDVEIKKIK